MTLAGGCLCGAVRYRCDGLSDDVAHCHCRLCQRSAGAGFLTWATYLAADVCYTAGCAASFRSSPGAVREFCGACGTQLMFRADSGHTVDVTVASLDEPDRLFPTSNIWTGSRRTWIHGFDRCLPDNLEETSPRYF